MLGRLCCKAQPKIPRAACGFRRGSSPHPLRRFTRSAYEGRGERIPLARWQSEQGALLSTRKAKWEMSCKYIEENSNRFTTRKGAATGI